MAWTVSAGGGKVVVCGGGEAHVREAGGWRRVGAAAAALCPAGRLALLEPGGLAARLEGEGPGAEWRLRRPGRRLFAASAADGAPLLAVADREGAAFSLQSGSEPLQLAGHLGAMLAVALTDRCALTCDRDEKIRVARFPRTRDVLGYCLGHEQFVNGLELLPHDPLCLLSCSGDGTVRLWEYEKGREILSIDVSKKEEGGENAERLRLEMKKREIDLEKLPVKKMVCVENDEESSTLVVSLYASDKLYTYRVSGRLPALTYEFADTISLKSRPIDLAAEGEKLWICLSDESQVTLQEWRLSKLGAGEFVSETRVIAFESHKPIREEIEELSYLYKRKIDNIQEYCDRKRKRLKIQN